ncbi:MAG TPA: hypothetical protein VF894_09375 [Anaeromyxobacter sp.]
MLRASRITRAQVVALPRTQVAVTSEWIVAGIALTLLLAGLLLP